MSYTVPPPPPRFPPPHRPIRPAKVWAGIGYAVLGQLVAIGAGGLLTYVLATGSHSEQAFYGVYLEVLLQALFFLACLIIGLVWIANRDRGIGIGLLIGWAVTTLVLPVVGIGVCVALVSRSGNL